MDTTRLIDYDKLARRARPRRLLFQPTFIMPIIVLSVVVILAIFAPLLAPYPYDQINMSERLMAPFSTGEGGNYHLLGTDHMGRDILSRVIYGAQISFSIALLVIFITSSIGTVVGIISGYLVRRSSYALIAS